MRFVSSEPDDGGEVMYDGFRAKCPRCSQHVSRVDGEYKMHYRKKKLCFMSRREIQARRK